MDSSIRLKMVQGVLGELSWRPEDLNGAEWREVLTTILEEHSKEIGFLPGYKPIKDWLQERPYSAEDSTHTDIDKVSLGPDLALETKCIKLNSLSHTTEGDASKIHTLGYGCRYVREGKLYLTHKGRFVLSNRMYERVFKSRGDKPGRTTITETTCSWDWTIRDGTDLEALLEPKVALRILDALGACAVQGVNERRHRLSLMEGFHRTLKGASTRVGHYDSWHSV